MDKRQNVLETLHRGHPEALVNEWEPFEIVPDPLIGQVRVVGRGETAKDFWGVTYFWGEDEPGPMPIINDKTKLLPDITKWRDYIHAPSWDASTFDWTNTHEQMARVRAEGKLAMSITVRGMFEQAHFFMGFEDTLAGFLEEPEAMHELMDYILDYKIMYAKLLIECSKPDIIMSHDDWGSKHNLFMSAEIWREFLKPRFEKLYKVYRDAGVLVMHHADSHCELIVKDMEEIGIDIWQGVLPQNNIPKIQTMLDKMILMGGIDAAIVDHKDYDEAVIRAEVRRCCDEYVPGGGFIPCLTYGGVGGLYPGVNEVIMDEISKISPKYFKQ